MKGKHAHMERDCHGLLKVSLGLPMYALKRPLAVSGVAALRVSSLRPSYYPFEYPMKYASGEWGRESKERGGKKGKRKGKGGRECLTAVSGVAARRANSLQPSYYPFEYSMKYASDEWGRESKERGVKKVVLLFF
jgi:hypothetical protein